MNNEVSLTPLERQFLKLCRNYDTAEMQRGDNYSNGGIEEAEAMFTGPNKRQAAGGLLTSLKNKGMGDLDTEYDQFVLSDEGITEAFRE